MSIATPELQHQQAGSHQTGRGACVDWSLASGDTAAVPSVRHEILDHLRQITAPGSDLSSAELVVGELLANAVTHAAGVASISLAWDGPHPLLRVADDGADLATVGSDGNRNSTLSSIGTSVSTSHATARNRSRHGAAARTLAGLRVGQLPEDLLADGGRGLYLVSRLALDVSVTPRPHGGILVEVVLDLTRPD
jgi:anti-sigma regulatory factor (Ser/Thr protein kinase)